MDFLVYHSRGSSRSEIISCLTVTVITLERPCKVDMAICRYLRCVSELIQTVFALHRRLVSFEGLFLSSVQTEPDPNVFLLGLYCMQTTGGSNLNGVGRMLLMFGVLPTVKFGLSLVRRILFKTTNIVISWGGDFIGVGLQWLCVVASVLVLLLKPYIGSLGGQLVRLMGVFQASKRGKALCSLELFGFELQLLVSHSSAYLCHFLVPLQDHLHESHLLLLEGKDNLLHCLGFRLLTLGRVLSQHVNLELVLAGKPSHFAIDTIKHLIDFLNGSSLGRPLQLRQFALQSMQSLLQDVDVLLFLIQVRLTGLQPVLHNCGLVNEFISLSGLHGDYLLELRVVVLEGQHLGLHTGEQIGNVRLGQSGEHLWGDGGILEETTEGEDVLGVVGRQPGQGHPVEVS